MTGPVERSLRWYRKNSWWAFPVSRYIPQARRTIDVAGFGDILAYSPALRVIELCQATTTANQAARLGKILALGSAEAWVKAGGQVVVHGWTKRGARNKRKLWQVTITPVLGFDLGEGEAG